MEGEDVADVEPVLLIDRKVKSASSEDRIVLWRARRGQRVSRAERVTRFYPVSERHRGEKHERDGHHADEYRDEEDNSPYQEYPELQRN